MAAGSQNVAAGLQPAEVLVAASLQPAEWAGSKPAPTEDPPRVPSLVAAGLQPAEWAGSKPAPTVKYGSRLVVIAD